MSYTLYLLKQENSDFYYLSYCDTFFFDRDLEILQASNPAELILIKQCEFDSTEDVELVEYIIENLIGYLEVRPGSSWYKLPQIYVRKVKDMMDIQIAKEETAY